ncbi:tyrosine-type recombinase/integrase [Sulfitobacter sp.]|uniref:tyrosine-type recombinase/integrase n=1 Tax=Sulfitobacter sp. TaxID=1903071 RepID=UPI0035641A9A
MASIRKLKTGRWQAQIARKGIRKSKLFDSKRAATDWSAREEYLILTAPPTGETMLLSEAFQRYANEVSPTRRGERWEIIRLRKFARDPLASKTIASITGKDIAEWRDKRLQDVAPASVRREMELMSAVFTIARAEWKLITVSPMLDIRRPKSSPARKRRVSEAEFAALSISAGSDLSAATARAYHAFLFAVETGMRAGEIVGLTWANVSIDERTAHLPKTKNGFPRDVPLSSEAVRLLEALPDTDPVFDLTSRQLDVLWRKLCDRAAVKGLTFHDSRHEAITRLARRVDVLDLARIVGHKNISQLMTYYDATAGEIAERLG